MPRRYLIFEISSVSRYQQSTRLQSQILIRWLLGASSLTKILRFLLRCRLYRQNHSLLQTTTKARFFSSFQISFTICWHLAQECCHPEFTFILTLNQYFDFRQVMKAMSSKNLSLSYEQQHSFDQLTRWHWRFSRLWRHLSSSQSYSHATSLESDFTAVAFSTRQLSFYLKHSYFPLGQRLLNGQPRSY